MRGTAGSDIAPSQTISFSFTLQNRPQQQNAQTITVKSPALFVDTPLSGSGDVMRILPLEFPVAHTEQSSHYPCAPNTITVRLRMNIPLLSVCRNADDTSLYNRYPDITISGLTGARNNVISTLSGDSPFDGVQPVFDAAAGTVTIQQNADTQGDEPGPSTEYEFTFDITNQAKPQVPAPDISVEADILTSTALIMSPMSSDANYRTMYM